MKEEEIKKAIQEKFSIQTISLQSLQGPGAISEETYKLIDNNNNKYKLRISSRAKEIEKNVKKFKKWFPKLYGRHKEILLFEWIDAPTWREAQLTPAVEKEACYQLGKMIGEIHEAKEINKNKSAKEFFEDCIQEIKKEKRTEKDLIEQAEELHKEFLKKIQTDIVLELNDIHTRNMIIKNSHHPTKARVYFVDEDGLGHKIKGLGLAKPLLIEKFISTKTQVESFWKGYNEHHSNNYFDKDYQSYVQLVQLVRTIATRTRIKANEKSFQEAKERLKEFLKKHD